MSTRRSSSNNTSSKWEVPSYSSCDLDTNNNNNDNNSSCCPGWVCELNRRLPWYWLPALVLLGASWAGSYYVHQNCAFVYLSSSSSTSQEEEETVEIRRGATRGQLTPDDACKPWNEYENLTLDKYMTLTVYSATLPLILGAITIAILLFIYPCLDRQLICARAFFQWIATFLATSCAVFQTLTHFMVPSQMCHESPLITNGQGWSCETTITYFATFFTMAGWALAAILMVDCSCLSCKQGCKPIPSEDSLL